MKIISVVGARPNFMKIAPFIRAIEEYNSSGPDETIEHTLVHTGQHYDDRMSKAFFKALNIPDADINLGIGSGTHAEQVGQTMIAFEKVVKDIEPDWVVVVGDVNATLACSVTAKKENVKCCHIEAGLRSGDMTMPEEINRLVTDRLSDLLLIPDKLSGENLKKEGASERSVVFVGNIMIDTLDANLAKAKDISIEEIINKNYLIESAAQKKVEDNFAVLTLHRPSNVDEKEILTPIVNFLCDEVAEDMPLIWTVHPRTQKQLKLFGLWEKVTSAENIILLHPLSYHEMLRLNMDAKIMLTDSGGLQEECTVLGTPCITLRWNTERPITLRQHGGASVIVGNNIKRIREEYQKTLLLDRTPTRPKLWDGQTAHRCLDAIISFNK
ncbi:MAG: UDP-N-acetylglucosamine 2-epimerase (non-hydrolyzing) [Bacteroidales bacterium]|nr:UDP-N-acetylglucosamine 2-epimerase (non-hydrolyzing) [Bacteroidales bacterium]